MIISSVLLCTPNPPQRKKSRGHTPVIEENLLIHSDTNV